MLCKSHSCAANVCLVKPQIINLEKVKELEKGDSYQLTCSATGTPLPTVVWRRGGVQDPRQVVSISIIEKGYLLLRENLLCGLII